MGLIQSASTVYAVAYLTELGRQYLFDSNKKPRYINGPGGTTIDRLRIERFSLGDPDVNYELPLLPESGDVPDLSGENENAITGAKGRQLNNLINPGVATFVDTEDISYSSTFDVVSFDLSQSLESLKTVVTQQLLTFIDGAPVSDGLYYVTPTNYGNNYVDQSSIMTIVLKEPTTTEVGYRLRIFYPKSGGAWNKMVFQFEKCSPLTSGTVTTTTSTTVTSTTGGVILSPTPVTSTPVTPVTTNTAGR